MSESLSDILWETSKRDSILKFMISPFARSQSLKERPHHPILTFISVLLIKRYKDQIKPQKGVRTSLSSWCSPNVLELQMLSRSSEHCCNFYISRELQVGQSWLSDCSVYYLTIRRNLTDAEINSSLFINYSNCSGCSIVFFFKVI